MVSSGQIGVFYCTCGGSLGMDGLLEAVSGLNSRVAQRVHPALCSRAGQEYISDVIAGERVETVVVAGCSPSEHGETFRILLERNGMPASRLVVANIREQVHWVVPGKEEAMRKGLRVVARALARAAQVLEVQNVSGISRERVLVVGTGPSGLLTAISLSQWGREVLLVEGDGLMDPAGEFTPSKDETTRLAAEIPLIKYLPGSLLHYLEGDPGNFAAHIRTQDGLVVEPVGAVILAGLYEEAPGIPEELPDAWRVISQHGLNKILLQDQEPALLREVSVGRSGYPKVVFALDWIGEDPQFLHGMALNNLQQLVKKLHLQKQQADVYYLCRQVRVSAAQGLEEVYGRMREAGAKFIKFIGTPKIVNTETGPVLQVEDPTLGNQGISGLLNIPVDLLVTGMSVAAPAGYQRWAKVLGIRPGLLSGEIWQGDGDINLRPSLSKRHGVYLVGATGSYPGQGEARLATQLAAWEAHKFLMNIKDGRCTGENVCVEDPVVTSCAACLTCVRMCPHGAMIVEGKARVMENSCEGCGICVSECPARALKLPNCSDAQLLGVMEQ